MDNIINCFKPFFYFIYLCGVNVFPKDEEPGMLAKLIPFISNIVFKLLAIIFLFILASFLLLIDYTKENVDSSYNIFLRGIPLLLTVYLCFFCKIYCIADKQKESLQLLYSYLKPMARSVDADNSSNSAAKSLGRVLLFTFLFKISLMLVPTFCILAYSCQGIVDMILVSFVLFPLYFIIIVSLFLSTYNAVLHLYNIILIQMYTNLQMTSGFTSNVLNVHVDFTRQLRKYSDLGKMITILNSAFSQVQLLISILLLFTNSFIFFVLKLISVERDAFWICMYLVVLIVPFAGCFENLFFFILALISAAKLTHAVSLHFLSMILNVIL